MTEPAPLAIPSALPPTEAELVVWRALSRDEQLARYRAVLAAADAASPSAATTADVLAAARERVAARHG